MIALQTPRSATETRVVQGTDTKGVNWDRIVHQDGPQLFGLFRRHGLQVADAQDLVQDVLIDAYKSTIGADVHQTRSVSSSVVDIGRQKLHAFLKEQRHDGLVVDCADLD